MKIKIIKDNDQVFIEYDENKEPFSFETIDKLIDIFVKNDEIQFENCDESLSKYKDLISKIFDETKTDSFKNTYATLAKKDITNDELINIIENNQIDK